MSAPQTNIERQKRNHRGPLIGIIASLALVAILFFVFVGDATSPESSLLGEGPIEAAPITK